jgi:hypothetical protein
MSRLVRFGLLYAVAIAGGIVAGLRIFDSIAN